MRQPLIVVALLAVAASLTACKSSTDTTDVDARADAPVTTPRPAALAAPVEILGGIQGTDLRIEDHTLVILDRSAYDQLGLSEKFAAQDIDVDLDRHSVILLSLGEQPTGGYSTQITALQLKDDTLYVQATAAAPAAGDATTQALTYPYSAVVVEKLPTGLTVRSDITSLE